jgi:predicted site-specific integrase-resolvase
MTDLPNKEWLLLVEVMEHLRISESTVRRRIKDGSLEALRRKGVLRINRQSLRRFIGGSDGIKM